MFTSIYFLLSYLHMLLIFIIVSLYHSEPLLMGFNQDWQDFLAKDPQQTGGMLNVSGAGDFAISNRISYEYNLKGPR